MSAVQVQPVPHNNSRFIKRKPPPQNIFSARYPPVDPEDPFAPLSILRGRISSTQGFPNSEVLPSAIPLSPSNTNTRPNSPFLVPYTGNIVASHYRPRSQSNPTFFPSTHAASVPPSRRPTPVPSILPDDASTHVSDSHEHLPPIDNHRYRNARTAFPLLSPDSPSPSPSPSTSKSPSPSPRFIQHKRSEATLVSTEIHDTRRKYPPLPPSPLPYYPAAPETDFDPYLEVRQSPSPSPATTRSLNRRSTAETLASLIAESESSSLSPLFAITPEPTPIHDLAHYTHAKGSHSHHRLPSTDSTSTYKTSKLRHNRSLLRRPSSKKSKLSSSSTSSLPFDETKLPTIQQLAEAASIDVISESGVRVPFGQLWLEKKTVVCFIRHFWCSNCQEYMYSISRNIDLGVVRRAGVNLVVISNGSYNMIGPYRQIFHTSIPIYTDPTNRLYATLGMTLRSLSPGPDSQRGSYVRRNMLRGIAMVVVNAFKVRMPMFENGGDISQLGGEFVLGPGLVCTYAHRMPTTRGHAPIARVLEAAGVNVFATVERASLSGLTVLGMSDEERERWMLLREKKLERIKERKERRRRGNTGMVPAGGSAGGRRDGRIWDACACEADSASEDLGTFHGDAGEGVVSDEGEEEEMGDAPESEDDWYASEGKSGLESSRLSLETASL